MTTVFALKRRGDPASTRVGRRCWIRTRGAALCAWAAVAIAPGLTLPCVAAGDHAVAARPRCFGAASRDVERPCHNPALDFVAIPSPSDARLETSAPCDPIPGSVPAVCSFGVARSRAVASVALIGDSHSTHWRAALAGVARAKRWRGYSINRNACPYTFARSPGPGRCVGWAPGVARWLAKHPSIRTVVVSANSGASVVAVPGRSRTETQIAGYLAAWDALPKSVRTVFVVHDVPHARITTGDCVANAVARHRKPALRCARSRGAALRTDPEAVAAERAPAGRVKLIDLSDFMCDRDECFPVVGGALVIKDVGHMTRTFSATLSPYLRRAMDRSA